MTNKSLVSMLVSIGTGFILGLVIYTLLIQIKMNPLQHFLVLYFSFPFTVSIVFILITFAIALGYAGYKIPKNLNEESFDLKKVAKAHSLAFNTIFWIGYIINYYSIGFPRPAPLAGLFFALFAFSLCLVIFPFTVSFLTVYIVSKIYPEES